MSDIYDKFKRSKIMSLISGKESKPEILVRKYLFLNGFRFRKNANNIYGKPDILLPKYKSVIFIHGCFWHGHKCKLSALPTSNIEFWKKKIQGNIDRDKKVKIELKKLGWNIFIIWGCQLNNKLKFEKTLNNLIQSIHSLNVLPKQTLS